MSLPSPTGSLPDGVTTTHGCGSSKFRHGPSIIFGVTPEIIAEGERVVDGPRDDH
jgi:hypothetical protein